MGQDLGHVDQVVAEGDPGHQPEVVAADVEDRPLAYGVGRGVDAANVLQVLPATVARSSVSSTPERIPPAAGLRAQTLTLMNSACSWSLTAVRQLVTACPPSLGRK